MPQPPHCETHEETIRTLARVEASHQSLLRGINRLYAASLALIGVAICAIFYAGALHQKVDHNTEDIQALKDDMRMYHPHVFDPDKRNEYP